MVNVIYRSHDGREDAVDLDEGTTLMHGAIHNGIDGIEGECGGSCSCATCHVYVEERFIDVISAPEGFELALLEGVACERRPTSRLSCQIIASSRIEGIVVEMPERQY